MVEAEAVVGRRSDRTRAGREIVATVSSDDGATLVRIAGEVDLSTAGDFRRVLLDVLHDAPAPPAVLVDLSGVPFMDSTGLGVLVAAVKRARARGGDITLVHPAEQLRSVLQLTGLNAVLPVQD